MGTCKRLIRKNHFSQVWCSSFGAEPLPRRGRGIGVGRKVGGGQGCKDCDGAWECSRVGTCHGHRDAMIATYFRICRRAASVKDAAWILLAALLIEDIDYTCYSVVLGAQEAVFNPSTILWVDLHHDLGTQAHLSFVRLNQ